MQSSASRWHRLAAHAHRSFILHSIQISVKQGAVIAFRFNYIMFSLLAIRLGTLQLFFFFFLFSSLCCCFTAAADIKGISERTINPLTN